MYLKSLNILCILVTLEVMLSLQVFLSIHTWFVYVCLGTEKARNISQVLQDVPYGQGEGEKLDVYLPQLTSAGRICPGFLPYKWLNDNIIYFLKQLRYCGRVCWWCFFLVFWWPNIQIFPEIWFLLLNFLFYQGCIPFTYCTVFSIKIYFSSSSASIFKIMSNQIWLIYSK